jgi:hypothetical protein
MPTEFITSTRIYAEVAGLTHAATVQVNAPVAGSFYSPGALFYGLVITVMLFIFVVGPAVWSRRAARRKAAAEVLDRILRFLRPGA